MQKPATDAAQAPIQKKHKDKLREKYLVCQGEQRGGDLLVGALEVTDQLGGKAVLLLRDERVGRALLARAPGPTNAVRVRVDVPGAVVVHHDLDRRDVQAARCIACICM
jgi:hypothetical protein